MKIARLAAATAVAALMAAGSASALTLNYNGPAAGSFATVTVKSTNPAANAGATNGRSVSAGAFDMSEPAATTFTGSFLAFCLDLGAFLASSSTYDITTSPFTGPSGGVDLTAVDGVTGTSGMDRIQKIFDSSYSVAVAEDKAITSAGFQLALWNAVYDTDWDVSNNAGAFWSKSAAGAGTVTKQANDYLTAAAAYGGAQKWNLSYLQNTKDPRNQNLVTASPVPLPAAGLLLLGALGGLAGLRRRRKAA